MLEFIKNFFTRNIGLKLTALVLALGLWFYIVNELNHGSEEERQFLNKVLPQEGVVAKKLTIRPVFIGKPRSGFIVDGNKVIVVPEFCIVVGSRDLLEKIKYAYTMPLDLRGANKAFTKSIALNPIAPGIYTEETLVQVTVPIEKASP